MSRVQHQRSRRVSFQDERHGGPRRLTASRHLESSSSDEDEDERRLREEEEEAEEQERRLSEQHGEAGEAPASKKRDAAAAASGETDKDIEDEYATATRAKKKPRPTLTPADLIGPKGLVRIKNEFPKSLKYRQTSRRSPSVGRRDSRKQREIEAAAAYGRAFVGAYQSFCYDLFPNLAFEDVLTRIETFGSKKEVKLYLQNMREDVRKTYLEGIFGVEKTERMLRQLEFGLEQQKNAPLTVPHDDRPAAPDAGSRADRDDEQELADETPASSSSRQASDTVAGTKPNGNGDQNGSEDTELGKNEGAAQNSVEQGNSKKRSNDDLDEGETEATFEEVEGRSKNEVNDDESEEEEFEASFEDELSQDPSESMQSATAGKVNKQDSGKETEKVASPKKSDSKGSSTGGSEVSHRKEAEKNVDIANKDLVDEASDDRDLNDSERLVMDSTQNGDADTEHANEAMIEEKMQAATERGSGRNSEGESDGTERQAECSNEQDGTELFAAPTDDQEQCDPAKDKDGVNGENATQDPTTPHIEEIDPNTRTPSVSQLEDSEEQLIADTSQSDNGLTMETATVVATLSCMEEDDPTATQLSSQGNESDDQMVIDCSQDDPGLTFRSNKTATVVPTMSSIVEEGYTLGTQQQMEASKENGSEEQLVVDGSQQEGRLTADFNEGDNGVPTLTQASECAQQSQQSQSMDY